ncbi:MAG: hypothetical protein GY778_26900 [bacterium]|nr:hypothetical protein [bacterium]
MRRLLTTLTAAVLAGCGARQMGGNNEAQLTAAEMVDACLGGETCDSGTICNDDDICQDGVTDIPRRPKCDPDNAETSWADAVELIHSGQLVRAFQSHSNHVSLHLADGTTVATCEPRIDAILEEVSLCGALCSDVEIATE